GLIFAPLFDIVLADLSDAEVGTGSGVLNAMQQFCGALGVAVLGTLFFHWLPDQGWYDATEAISWVAVGLYGVSFLAAFLLPLQADPTRPWYSGGTARCRIAADSAPQTKA